MFVENILPAAHKRLVMIDHAAPLVDAAKLLLDLHTDLVVVRGSDELLVGVLTKTDMVRHLSQCHGLGCVTATSTVMTRSVVLCRPGDALRDVWSIMKERGLKTPSWGKIPDR
jgi:predicted transcriptional regulator